MRQQPLQWHPAFQAVMQIELAEYQDWLKYSALPQKRERLVKQAEARA